MARGNGKRQMPKEDPPIPTIDNPPQAEPENVAADSGPANGGSNCSDDVKRQAYREALILKIAVESAQEVLNSKRGEYRAYLKAAGKKGVDTKSITNMLAMRFEDPDLILIEERERLKMYELSGFIPGIRAQLLDRLDIQEPTAREEEENQVLIAYDRGHLAGRSGHLRDTNPYQPGTLGHVKFLDGWTAGQRAIADEMAPEGDEPRADAWVEPVQRGLPYHNDDAMPGEMPAAVH
jgi:ribosome modulation factor